MQKHTTYYPFFDAKDFSLHFPFIFHDSLVLRTLKLKGGTGKMKREEFYRFVSALIQKQKIQRFVL